MYFHLFSTGDGGRVAVSRTARKARGRETGSFPKGVFCNHVVGVRGLPFNHNQWCDRSTSVSYSLLRQDLLSQNLISDRSTSVSIRTFTRPRRVWRHPGPEVYWSFRHFMEFSAERHNLTETVYDRSGASLSHSTHPRFTFCSSCKCLGGFGGGFAVKRNKKKKERVSWYFLLC